MVSWLLYIASSFVESVAVTLTIVKGEVPKCPRSGGDVGVERKVTGGCSMRFPEAFTPA